MKNTNWIKVTEQLPKCNFDVMVMTNGGEIYIDHMDEHNKWLHKHVTQWMNLKDFVRCVIYVSEDTKIEMEEKIHGWDKIV